MTCSEKTVTPLGAATQREHDTGPELELPDRHATPSMIATRRLTRRSRVPTRNRVNGTATSVDPR